MSINDKGGRLMSKSKLDMNHIITKQNTLNSLRPNYMSTQGLRFFSIYMSKINPLDQKTREIIFPVDDFQAIMGLTRINIEYLKKAAEIILQAVVSIDTPDGGFSAFQLFKECEVRKDANEQWIIRIDAHDKALPLLFELKGHYFKYKLWNTLRLKSRNQIRMYELLKQYEKIGYRTLSVKDLRLFLGIAPKEYSMYRDLKSKVLDVCQAALSEYTDIAFTYESYGKKGPRGKILNLKFNITKNENYRDPLSLEEFIDLQKVEEETNPWLMAEDQLELFIEDGKLNRREERILFFRDAVDGEFSKEQMNVLYDTLLENLHQKVFSDDIECCNHLARKYREMKMRAETGSVKSRFGYLKKLIEIG